MTAILKAKSKGSDNTGYNPFQVLHMPSIHKAYVVRALVPSLVGVTPRLKRPCKKCGLVEKLRGADTCWGCQ